MRQTTTLSVMVSFGSCFGTKAEPYLDLRRQVTSSYDSAAQWSSLLLQCADSHFDSDKDLLSQAVAAYLELQTDSEDTTKMVRVSLLQSISSCCIITRAEKLCTAVLGPVGSLVRLC